MNNNTLADFGMTIKVLRAVHTYFQSLFSAVEPYGDDFGPTKADALAQLEHDLESAYLDWSKSDEY